MAAAPYREIELDDSHPVYIYAHEEIKRPRGEYGIDRYVHEHTVTDEHEGATKRHLVSRVYHLCYAGLHYRVYFQNRNLAATVQGCSVLIANVLACRFVGPCDGTCGDRQAVSPADWPDSDERECFLQEVKVPSQPRTWHQMIRDKSYTICFVGLIFSTVVWVRELLFLGQEDGVVVTFATLLMSLCLAIILSRRLDDARRCRDWNDHQARLALGREAMGRRRVVLKVTSDTSSGVQVDEAVVVEPQTEPRRAGR